MVFIHIRALLSCATDYALLINRLAMNNLSGDRPGIRNRRSRLGESSANVCSALVSVTLWAISLLWLKSSSGETAVFLWWTCLLEVCVQTHARMFDISCKGSPSSVSRERLRSWALGYRVKPKTLHGFCPPKSRALTINMLSGLHS